MVDQPAPSTLDAALSLARIESKLDRIGDKVSDLVADRADHENRLRILESAPVVTTKMLAMWIVALAAIVGVIPIVSLIHVGS